MSDWRHEYPNFAAGVQFAHDHSLLVLAYSVAVIVIYAIVLLPVYRALAGQSGVSRFDNPYLQYTGPGLALDRDMGSCRSDTASENCGAAEPFASKKKLNGFDSEYGHLPAPRAHFADHPKRQEMAAQYGRSGFVDTQNLRYLTTTSRFLSGREPDAVMFADQEAVDAMQQEVHSLESAEDEGGAAVEGQMAAAQATVAAVAAVQSGQVPVDQAAAQAAAAAAAAGPAASQAAAQATAAVVAGQVPAPAAAAVASNFYAKHVSAGGEHRYEAAMKGM